MNKEKISNIGKHLFELIADFFPYFLALYLLTFILSFFFDFWLNSWQQPLLHLSLVIFGFIYFWKKGIFAEDRHDLAYDFSRLKVKLTGSRVVLVEKLKDGSMTQYAISTVILFLVFCPLFLWVGEYAVAEKSAICAFFILIFGVVLMFLEHLIG